MSQLVIFENYEVSSNGVTYHDPDKFHYFYSVGHESSKIYHQDNLDVMFNDLINDLKKVLGKAGLRQLKLSTIGI